MNLITRNTKQLKPKKKKWQQENVRNVGNTISEGEEYI